MYSALNQLGIDGPYDGIAAHLVFGRYRWAKRLLRAALPGAAGIDVGLETEARIRPSYIAATLRRLRGHIVGGHAAHSDALVALLCAERARIIVVRRDPRDILVSFADWICGRPDYFMHPDFAPLSREARVARLLNGGAGSGYQLRPFTEVLELAEPWLFMAGDVLVVGFEELIGPNGGGSSKRQTAAVSAICDHLDLSTPEDSSWMERIYGGTLTFNKGRIQRWRELESSDLQSEINEMLAPYVVRWGYGGQEDIGISSNRSLKNPSALGVALGK